MSKNLDAIPELTRKIHIDEPSNHNVIYNSPKDGYVKVYDGEKIVHYKVADFLIDMIGKNADVLYDYLESNKETNNVSKTNYNKMINILGKLDNPNSKLIKRNVHDIKCLFANEKNIIKKTLKDMKLI